MSVCCGVVKFMRSRCSDFGRHFAKAPRLARKPPPPPPPNRPLPPFGPGPPDEPLLPLLELEPRSLSKQACIAWNCAAVGRGMLRAMLNVRLRVFSFATIFGTTPS